MRELAIVVQNENKGVTPEDTIRAIKNRGFNNIFIQWYDDDKWEYGQEKQLWLARELGLNIIFAHLGYQKTNTIWLEGDEGDRQVERYKNDIRVCLENGINLVVMHVCGKDAPNYNELGLKRFREIADYAKELGVRIAFENTRNPEHLEYVISNIQNDNIGVCFDIGHAHTYYNDEFNFDLYKNRIFAVHFHDNDGTGIDQHLLPFDATVPWERIMPRLKNAGYSGPVTMESCYRNEYLENMSVDDFYKEAFERGEKIARLLEK